ncbi:MAG: hypothetical protein M1833_005884 [Piccolia ochrophora]|nr:MAG: hypothetical protein M1833_005884 [Piccolia ochrophora]
MLRHLTLTLLLTLLPLTALSIPQHPSSLFPRQDPAPAEVEQFSATEPQPWREPYTSRKYHTNRVACRKAVARLCAKPKSPSATFEDDCYVALEVKEHKTELLPTPFTCLLKMNALVRAGVGSEEGAAEGDPNDQASINVAKPDGIILPAKSILGGRRGVTFVDVSLPAYVVATVKRHMEDLGATYPY